MDPESAKQLIVLTIMLVISVFFSAAETALTSINKIRLKHLVEGGNKKAKLVQNLLETPNKVLSVILISYNIVNIGSSVLITDIALRLWGDKGLIIATILATVLIIIFCEIIPKSVAVINAERVAMIVALPIKWVSYIFSPIVQLLMLGVNKITGLFGIKGKKPMFTEEEFQTIIDVGEQEGVLKTHEKQMFTGIVALKEKQVREVLKTPRMDIVAIPFTASLEEIRQIIKDKQFTRYPVYDENIDNIIGILHSKYLFAMSEEEKNNFDISKYMRGIDRTILVPETKNLYNLFIEMKEKKNHMAVVIDEYFATYGIISLEDILETIVGEIEDETDIAEEKQIIELQEDYAIINPNINIHYFNDQFGTKIPNGDIESIGGFVLKILGRLPAEHEIMHWNDLEFTILSMTHNRIETIKVAKKGEMSSVEV